jgi:hypothetical protein
MKEHFSQRTTPQEDKGSKPANRLPDSPQPETRTLSLYKITPEGRVPGRVLECPRPLLPNQEVRVGGTRAIGGGTSKDSIRRAKKQAIKAKAARK